MNNIDWSLGFNLLENNLSWMSWNLFLAWIPLVLSIILFNRSYPRYIIWLIWLIFGLLLTIRHHTAWWVIKGLLSNTIALTLCLTMLSLGVGFWIWNRQISRNFLWWLGTITFILFLPNAPYVLTDIIHLIRAIRQGHSMEMVVFLLIPQYLLFFTLGFEAYVLSLINLGKFLRQLGWQDKAILATEITIHLLSALGIYLGRFLRLNSWNVLTSFHHLLSITFYVLTSKQALFILLITFLILLILYQLTKWITMGLTFQKT